MSNNDKIARAYARLSALKSTLDAADARDPQFPERYVREFHAALDHLAAVGHDVDEFRVPAQEVDYREGTIDPEGATYSADRWVDRGLLLAKLDAVLKYFEIVTANQQIGFDPKR